MRVAALTMWNEQPRAMYGSTYDNSLQCHREQPTGSIQPILVVIDVLWARPGLWRNALLKFKSLTALEIHLQRGIQPFPILTSCTLPGSEPDTRGASMTDKDTLRCWTVQLSALGSHPCNWIDNQHCYICFMIDSAEETLPTAFDFHIWCTGMCEPWRRVGAQWLAAN